MAEIPNWVDRLPVASTEMLLRLKRDLGRFLVDVDHTLAQRTATGTHALPAPERPDRVLRIREACERMRWKYSWAVKHWKALGGFKDLDGALKIRADVLGRHGRGNAC